MNKLEYQDYVRNNTSWKSIRAKAHKRQRDCLCCGSREELDIHHKTYERLGHEKVTDLQVLCRDCHYVWHERQKNFWHIRPSYVIHRISHFLQKSYSIEAREGN
jgi:cytochrome c